MRRRLLAAIFCTLIVNTLSAQTAQILVSDSVSIVQIKAKQKLQQQKLITLSDELAKMRSSISELESLTSENADQVAGSLERLAQSERAINATLQGFADRFEAQNATIEEVREVLDRRLDDMMLYTLGASVLILLLVLLAVRQATAVALKRQAANWNAFQEHIFKNR